MISEQLHRDLNTFIRIMVIALALGFLSFVIAHAEDKKPAADSTHQYIAKAQWLKQIEDNYKFADQELKGSQTPRQLELQEMMKTLLVMHQTIKAIEQDSIRVKK
jgi:hypothetical protein